jgi:hypothetical protein
MPEEGKMYSRIEKPSEKGERDRETERQRDRERERERDAMNILDRPGEMNNLVQTGYQTTRPGAVKARA